MEYINIFLILLTIMLLSITSYENFFDCSIQGYQQMSSSQDVCCPPNPTPYSSTNVWIYNNNKCLRQCVNASEAKDKKGNLKKKYKDYKQNGNVYCSEIINAT
jgi:hypothetical protein